MAVELRVPEVGESITEVEIGDWLKGEGDKANREDPLVMIETDKVTIELPAPVSGIISKIVVKKGSTAKVGDVIGYMEETAAASGPRPSTPAPAPSPVAAAPAAAPPPVAAAAPPPVAAAAPPVAKVAPPTTAEPSVARVMPAAQRSLHDAGMTAAEVTPSGPGGRVLKEDVQRAAEARPVPVKAPAPPAPRAPTNPSGDGSREEEIVAMTPLRRRIAERLVQAQQTTASLTTFNEVDMSAVMALRKEFQPQFQEKYGIKLGFMSFFVKACIDAAKLVPTVNAEVRGTDIVYKNYFDIGVAVGGGKGLVVPIIRNAERLGFAEVEKAISDLGERAKKNTIKLEELQGGTFTISNGGVYGSMMSTPILNPPQSGILGLHAINERPVVKDGQIVIRPMMYLALTYDHRIVDGREAVTFLKRVKETIESPARILLEV
jgi:2-oxoglutarate dehydrogenase E2 component (dihydrolipoamide succinyltransferase)